MGGDGTRGFLLFPCAFWRLVSHWRLELASIPGGAVRQLPSRRRRELATVPGGAVRAW